MCVPLDGKVMCTLATLNYNTVQIFEEVLIVATKALIPCFGMFVRTNIVVSFNGCVFVTAVLGHQLVQYIVNYSRAGRL
jgi:hypothetical protein